MKPVTVAYGSTSKRKMEASTTQRMVDSLERAWGHVLRLSVVESQLPGSPEWRALFNAMQTLQDSIKEVEKTRGFRAEEA